MRLPEEIAATLESGGAVLASSPRAARTLRLLYAEARSTLKAWRAPEILHWDGWLDSLWQQRLRAGSESRLLLSSSQEHRVWGRIVGPALEETSLISIEGVASLAQEAYALLCAFDALNFLHGDMHGGADVESFRQWALEFERWCREEGWVSRSLLATELSRAVHRESLRLPARLLLTGFDRITPAQDRMLAACAEAQCPVEQMSRTRSLSGAPAPVLIEASGQSEEIELCARWLASQLDRSIQEAKKTRVAVIAADMHALKSDIERVFRRTLAPQTLSLDSSPSLPYEFSLGVPLAQMPVVRSALTLLRWMEDSLPPNQVTWLLLSGFFASSGSELLPLAELDAELRKSKVLLPGEEFDDYLRRSGWSKSSAGAVLRDRLYAARRIWRGSQASELSFEGWRTKIEAILSAAGWPGEHVLAGEDYQVRAKWKQLLESIETLSFDGRPVRYTEFLQVLEREARQTLFSPESHDAPVQILGAYEAAGLVFDAVWFLGFDDEKWPAPGRPHPFLTGGVQKQFDMPHADSSADWRLAKMVTERIRQSAAECYFSYARQARDGARRPSSVLDPQPVIVQAAQFREQLTADGGALEFGRKAPLLEMEMEPAQGIVWPGGLSAGGQDVLKKQAACPFQAFAHYRLGARSPGTREWGLDALQRGDLLHKLLQSIWSDLKDSGALREASSQGRLEALVQRHVDKLLAPYGGRSGAGPARQESANQPDSDEPQTGWSAAYIACERQRIVSLIQDWLLLESERPPFEVWKQEEQFMARVGDLELKLRADRVDAIAGSKVLIDYKTGKVTSTAWSGERPDEPQLPLYAAYGNLEDLRGVVFASVRSGEMKFEGLLENSSLLPSAKRGRKMLKSYSGAVLQAWKATLLTLAEDFVSGRAQVDPKRGPTTCELCDLRGLCRVAEAPSGRIESDLGCEDGDTESEDE